LHGSLLTDSCGAMPAHSAHHPALLLLDRRITRARARVRHLQTTLERKHAVVVEARLVAAQLRLAQLCLERQHLRAELERQPRRQGLPEPRTASAPFQGTDVAAEA
jgi:hypothetical protein